MATRKQTKSSRPSRRPTQHPHHGYGWIPDLPDRRDYLYAAPLETLAKLPPSADLTRRCPSVYDQGQLGSCTANAIGAAFEFERMKQKLATWMPSRLFIYYNERVMEHTVASDAGAMIRDGIKSIAKQGVCPETAWPYVIAKFAKKPPQAAYTAAAQNKSVSYSRVARSLDAMRGCLASGYPFVLGITVYDSFESQQVAKTGVVNLPKTGESSLGGHAVMAVGYNDKTQRFRIRNSWGASWGQKGYFTLPYTYLTNEDLSSDFWTIRVVE